MSLCDIPWTTVTHYFKCEVSPNGLHETTRAQTSVDNYVRSSAPECQDNGGIEDPGGGGGSAGP